MAAVTLVQSGVRLSTGNYSLANYSGREGIKEPSPDEEIVNLWISQYLAIGQDIPLYFGT